MSISVRSPSIVCSLRRLFWVCADVREPYTENRGTTGYTIRSDPPTEMMRSDSEGSPPNANAWANRDRSDVVVFGGPNVIHVVFESSWALGIDVIFGLGRHIDRIPKRHGVEIDGSPFVMQRNARTNRLNATDYVGALWEPSTVIRSSGDGDCRDCRRS